MDDIKPGYTRISEILSQWNNFSHIDPEVLARKAELGTSVHAAIKAYEEGIYIPLSEKEKPYFESYVKWKNIFKPSYIEMEKRYYDDTWMITGQIDGVLKVDQSEVIIDFKTSAQEDKRKWIIQGGFYHMLYSQKNNKVDNTVLFIQLDKKGELPKVHRYEISSSIRLICASCISTYRHFHG